MQTAKEDEAFQEQLHQGIQYTEEMQELLRREVNKFIKLVVVCDIFHLALVVYCFCISEIHSMQNQKMLFFFIQGYVHLGDNIKS